MLFPLPHHPSPKKDLLEQLLQRKEANKTPPQSVISSNHFPLGRLVFHPTFYNTAIASSSPLFHVIIHRCMHAILNIRPPFCTPCRTNKILSPEIFSAVLLRITFTVISKPWLWFVVAEINCRFRRADSTLMLGTVFILILQGVTTMMELGYYYYYFTTL